MNREAAYECFASLVAKIGHNPVQQYYSKLDKIKQNKVMSYVPKWKQNSDLLVSNSSPDITPQEIDRNSALHNEKRMSTGKPQQTIDLDDKLLSSLKSSQWQERLSGLAKNSTLLTELQL